MAPSQEREDQSAPADWPGLTDLFQQHSRRVLNVARRVTGSAEDAEDVLQTVFLRLARTERALDERAGSYLHKAAVNASLDLLRSRKRAKAVMLDDSDTGLAADPSEQPHRRQSEKEFHQQLRAALSNLPGRGAEVFILKYFEGLRNKEIAQMLELGQTTVAVTLHRAKSRLRVQLEGYVGGQKS